MRGIELVVVGVVFLVLGLERRRGANEALARRRRVLATPLAAIGPAGSAAPRAVSTLAARGRVSPTEQGTLTAPFSGREVVWLRTLVEEQRSHGRSARWVVLSDEVHARDFMLEDSTGRLRVRPQEAYVSVTARRVARSGVFRPPGPALLHFLAARQLPPKTLFGLGRTLRYREETLAPGDEVFAVGPAHFEAGEAVADGYRSAPTTALVLASGPSPEGLTAPAGPGELLLSDRPLRVLARRLLLRATVGYALLAGGALLVLWALLSWVSGPG